MASGREVYLVYNKTSTEIVSFDCIYFTAGSRINLYFNIFYVTLCCYLLQIHNIFISTIINILYFSILNILKR